MPKATPWKATLTTDERSSPRALLLLLEFLPGVHHCGTQRFELDVDQLAADPLHLAQVLGLDDVARLRVDGDRPARAVRVLPLLEDLHRPLRVELALLLLDRLDDDRRPVVGAHGDEVRRLVLAVLLLPGRDERLVRRARRA